MAAFQYCCLSAMAVVQLRLGLAPGALGKRNLGDPRDNVVGVCLGGGISLSLPA